MVGILGWKCIVHWVILIYRLKITTASHTALSRILTVSEHLSFRFQIMSSQFILRNHSKLSRKTVHCGGGFRLSFCIYHCTLLYTLHTSHYSLLTFVGDIFRICHKMNTPYPPDGSFLQLNLECGKFRVCPSAIDMDHGYGWVFLLLWSWKKTR